MDFFRSCGLPCRKESTVLIANPDGSVEKARTDIEIFALNVGKPELDGKGAHFDITIKNEMAATYVCKASTIPGHAAALGEAEKNRHYLQAIKSKGQLFFPLSCEAHGFWGKSFISVFKMCIDKNYGADTEVERRTFSAYRRARFSCTFWKMESFNTERKAHQLLNSNSFSFSHSKRSDTFNHHRESFLIYPERHEVPDGVRDLLH